jgi:acetyl esterase/lipase
MKASLVAITRALLALVTLCVPLSPAHAQATASGLLQPETFTYREIDGRALKAYVFRPASEHTEPHPAILLFHGGAWQLGDATWLFGRARDFAREGLVAISIEYTLAINGHSPIDGVGDTVTAFRWSRAHAKDLDLDPHRVAGYGVSAGGHLVAAAATLPDVRGRKLTPDDRPNAVLLFSPALNMAKDPYFMRLMNGHGDPALYSPSQYITPALPPTLIIQGAEDTIVFAKDARSFCVDAAKNNVRCELHVYPGVGHLLFDVDPTYGAEALHLEDAFLHSLGYTK